MDGTITKEETLPKIAKYFDISKEIDTLTKDAISGNISFEDSFIKRVEILKDYPISEVAFLLKSTKLFDELVDFIQLHKHQCAIITGNLDVWIEHLVKKLGCKVYSSKAIVKNDKIIKIKTILNKENIVKRYKALGLNVVVIGDSYNDIDAMKCANISIASTMVHQVDNSVLEVAQHIINDIDQLLKLLKGYKNENR